MKEPVAALTYCGKDAECCARFLAAWDEKLIQVDGVWYDRAAWARYKRDKKHWAREDPTVVVPLPKG